VLDVDVVVDASDVYPDGWTLLVAEVERLLSRQQKHLASVHVGGAHSVALSDTVGT
jgi:hypothetical protein